MINIDTASQIVLRVARITQSLRRRVMRIPGFWQAGLPLGIKSSIEPATIVRRTAWNVGIGRMALQRSIARCIRWRRWRCTASG
jgi:hypothetical protein